MREGKLLTNRELAQLEGTAAAGSPALSARAPAAASPKPPAAAKRPMLGQPIPKGGSGKPPSQRGGKGDKKGKGKAKRRSGLAAAASAADGVLEALPTKDWYMQVLSTRRVPVVDVDGAPMGDAAAGGGDAAAGAADAAALQARPTTGAKPKKQAKSKQANKHGGAEL